MTKQRTSYMAYRDGEEPDGDDPLLAFTPAPHIAPRRNSIGPERQRAFVAHLAACGIVTQAAKHIGASLEALYKLRHRPGAEEFSAAWDAAVERGVARIEDGALQRASMAAGCLPCDSSPQPRHHSPRIYGPFVSFIWGCGPLNESGR